MKVTFPHMGNLYIPIKALLQEMGVDLVVPPPITKKTLDIGVKHSPEFACLPLKLTIGNFIEAFELGANTIVMAGGVGPCRFGYYGEVQREILKGLDRNFEMVILEPPKNHFFDLMEQLKKLFKKNLVPWKLMRAIRLAWWKAITLDEVEKCTHITRPLEKTRGDTERLYSKLVKKIDNLQGEKEIMLLKKDLDESFGEIPVKEIPILPRIGLVGEIYTVLEPFSNLFIERQLGELGAQVNRSIYISEWIRENLFPGFLRTQEHKLLLRKAKPYINSFVGGHGQETVAETVRFSQLGCDGVIQVLPFTCMPEIVAKSVLPKVARDKSIPVMSIVLDEHSAETGLRTRLEAFTDMIRYKLEAESHEEVFARY